MIWIDRNATPTQSIPSVSVISYCPLHWRHNGNDGVSNHQPHGCLLNRLFRRRSKKTSKLRVTGLCVGNSPDRWIPRTKGQWRGKCFHLMTSSCLIMIFVLHFRSEIVGTAFSLEKCQFKGWLYFSNRLDIVLTRTQNGVNILFCFIRSFSRLQGISWESNFA